MLAVHSSFPESKIAQTRKFLRCASMSKVASYLQWAKCCRNNLGGKKPLFINMDETSVSFHYGRQKGLVVSRHYLPPNWKHKKEFMSHDTHRLKMLPQHEL